MGYGRLLDCHQDVLLVIQQKEPAIVRCEAHGQRYRMTLGCREFHRNALGGRRCQP
jgi:hypothetical protein